jgi:hypothetical protein
VNLPALQGPEVAQARAARRVFEEGDIMLLEGKTAVITGAGHRPGQCDSPAPRLQSPGGRG